MSKQHPQPTLVWPRYALAGLTLFLIVSVFWVLGAIKRVREIKASTYGLTTPGTPATPPPKPAAPRPLSAVTNGMVWIPAGTFSMGSEDGQTDERPVHEVTVDGFWVDKTEVTNEEFEKFIRATGYVTVAERKPEAKDYPGVPPGKLVAGSIVFHPPNREVSLQDHSEWWEYVPG